MYNKTMLPSGVRVLTEEVPSVFSVSIGIWVTCGSRYELEAERGMSHFIEHLLFKGTKTRTAQDIAREIDSLGGILNAFTSKEYTCFFAKIFTGPTCE
jgi:predicted Zn-dependent peptidase